MNFQEDELGRRKFQPQRCTIADMLEDNHPACKIETVENEKWEKPVLNYHPFIINPSDWEDSPIVNQATKTRKGVGSTRKDIAKKKIPHGKVANIRSQYVPIPKKTGTVRKELFSGSKTKTFKKPLQQRQPTRKSLKLDNTQPLTDMGEAEKELIKSSHIFAPLKEKCNAVAAVPQKRKITESKKTSGMSTKKFKFDSPNSITTINYSLESSKLLTISSFGVLATDIDTSIEEENEFLENERNINNNLEPAEKVLHKNHEHCKDLKKKFLNLRKIFKTFVDTFEVEMNSFQEKIENHECNCMEDGARKFKTDEEWHISTGPTVDSAASEKIATIKRNVTFNLKSEKENTNISLDDNGFQKSVSLYNSMKKNQNF